MQRNGVLRGAFVMQCWQAELRRHSNELKALRLLQTRHKLSKHSKHQSIRNAISHPSTTWHIPNGQANERRFWYRYIVSVRMHIVFTRRPHAMRGNRTAATASSSSLRANARSASDTENHIECEPFSTEQTPNREQALRVSESFYLSPYGFRASLKFEDAANVVAAVAARDDNNDDDTLTTTHSSTGIFGFV